MADWESEARSQGCGSKAHECAQKSAKTKAMKNERKEQLQNVKKQKDMQTLFIQRNQNNLKNGTPAGHHRCNGAQEQDTESEHTCTGQQFHTHCFARTSRHAMHDTDTEHGTRFPSLSITVSRRLRRQQADCDDQAVCIRLCLKEILF